MLDVSGEALGLRVARLSGVLWGLNVHVSVQCQDVRFT